MNQLFQRCIHVQSLEKKAWDILMYKKNSDERYITRKSLHSISAEEQNDSDNNQSINLLHFEQDKSHERNYLEFKHDTSFDSLVFEQEEDFDTLLCDFFITYPYDFSYKKMTVQEFPNLLNELRQESFKQTSLFEILEDLKNNKIVPQYKIINALKSFGDFSPTGKGSEHNFTFYSYDEKNKQIEHTINHFDIKHGNREKIYRKEDTVGRGSLVMLIKKFKEVGYYA